MDEGLCSTLSRSKFLARSQRQSTVLQVTILGKGTVHNLCNAGVMEVKDFSGFFYLLVNFKFLFISELS